MVCSAQKVKVAVKSAKIGASSHVTNSILKNAAKWFMQVRSHIATPEPYEIRERDLLQQNSLGTALNFVPLIAEVIQHASCSQHYSIHSSHTFHMIADFQRSNLNEHVAYKRRGPGRK